MPENVKHYVVISLRYVIFFAQLFVVGLEA